MIYYLKNETKNFIQKQQKRFAEKNNNMKSQLDFDTKNIYINDTS